MDKTHNKYNRIDEYDLLMERMNAISKLNFTSELELINYVVESAINLTMSHKFFFIR